MSKKVFKLSNDEISDIRLALALKRRKYMALVKRFPDDEDIWGEVVESYDNLLKKFAT